MPRAEGKTAATKDAAEPAPTVVRSTKTSTTASERKSPAPAGAAKVAARADPEKPVVAKPAAGKPTASEPAAAKPAVAKAAGVKPAVAKAATVKAAVARPDVAKPEVVKPVKAAKAAVAKPAVRSAAAEGALATARAALVEEHARLTSERASLQAGLEEVIRDSASGSGDDQADSGAKTFGREQEQVLLDRVAEALDQNERALARVDEGSYGSCESCGKPIGAARLEAYPRATLCVACKQREERR